MSRTFDRPNGLRVAEVAGESLNYRTSNGKWLPIDSSLVVESGGWRNAANRYSVHLPSAVTSPVSFEFGDVSLSFTLAGAAGEGRSDGKTVTYPGAFPGVDVAYRAEADRLKETFALADRAAQRSFVFDVVTSPGAELIAAPDGGVDVVRAGTVMFSLAAPFLDDAAGAHSDAASLSVSGSAGTWRLTLDVASPWLESPERAWPVVVDPVVTFQPATLDCYLNQAATTTNYCGATTLAVSNISASERRSIIRFDALTSTIPNDALVMHAKLLLKLASRTGSDVSTNVSLNRITTASWTGSATWDKYNSTTNWTSAGGDYTTTGAVTRGVVGVGTTQAWYITALVKSWVDESVANNGMLLRAPAASDEMRFASNENGTSSDAPSLWVEYEPRYGSGPYTLVRHKLTDQTTLGVNVANGNLNVTNRDLAIRGTGLDLGVAHNYDSLPTSTGDVGTDFNLTIKSKPEVWEFDDGSLGYWDFSGPVGAFTPDGAGGYTAPPGANASLSHDTVAGTYTVTDNKSQSKLKFKNGKIREHKDRNNNTITWNYDVSDNLTGVTDTVGRTTSVTYSGTFISRVTDSTGRHVDFARYAGGCNCALQTYTDANNKTLTYDYDAGGNLHWITDALGKKTRIDYDANGRVSDLYRYTNPPTNTLAHRWTFAYTVTSPGGSTVVTDPNSHTTTYAWDNSDRVTQTTDALGHAHSGAYNTNNDPTSFTDGLSAVTSLTYSTTNNLSSILSPASDGSHTAASTSFNYNTSSGVTGYSYLASSKTDPQGKCQSFKYTTGGNLSDVYDGTGNTCDNPTSGARYTNAYQSDPTAGCGGHTGQLCSSTDPRGNATTYAYTYSATAPAVLNAMVVTPPTESSTPPTQLGATTTTFDALTRVSTVTDGKSQKTLYCYDSLDRVTKLYYGAGSGTACSTASPSITYTYDDTGNLTSRADSTGTTTFDYDALQRPVRKTLPDTTTVCAADTKTPKGITFTWDGASNMTQYCDAGGAINYTYDNADRVTGLAEPGGSCTGTVTLCTTFGNDNADRRTSTTYPGGASLTTTYNTAGDITSIVGKQATTPIITSFSYTYTVGSQDTMLRQSMSNAGTSTFYAYDNANRLCAVSAAASPTCTTTGITRYGYDANGNRTSVTNSTNVTTTYAFNKNNELCGNTCTVVTYGYDANGNETSAPSSSTFTLNNRDQIIATTFGGVTLSSITYADTGQAERTAYTQGTATTSLATTPLGVMISRSSTSSTSYYTRDPSGHLIGERVGGTRYYYLSDGLGSTVALINDTGTSLYNTYTYDAWGMTTATTGTIANPWRYASGYQDPTGLTKFGARYYDAADGRWTQPDPLGGTISNPNEVNRYTYVGGNPLNNIDTLGLYICRSTAQKANFDAIMLGGSIGEIPALGPFTIPSALGSLTSLRGNIRRLRSETGADRGCGIFGDSRTREIELA